MSITINGVDTRKLSLKQKEGKLLKFTYSIAIDTATFSLIVKDRSGTIIFTKLDAVFDKTLISTKIVKVYLTVTDLDIAVDTYLMELKTTWDAAISVDKTENIKLKIKESLHS